MTTAAPATRWQGRLYAAIARAGYRLDGFAQRMDCHRSTLWRIDHGQIEPTPEWTRRAERLLGLNARRRTTSGVS